MGKMIDTKIENDTGILVTVAPKQESDLKIKEFLDELEFLAQTLNIDTKNDLLRNCNTRIPEHL